jgi:hypothetical protein
VTGPDDVPVGDLYDEPSDYLGGWHAIQVDLTEPQVLGTLYVVTDAGEERWTLLDRQPIRFGFCRPE